MTSSIRAIAFHVSRNVQRFVDTLSVHASFHYFPVDLHWLADTAFARAFAIYFLLSRLIDISFADSFIFISPFQLSPDYFREAFFFHYGFAAIDSSLRSSLSFVLPRYFAEALASALHRRRFSADTAASSSVVFHSVFFF